MINHQNFAYSGGVPLQAGDRYYGQDLGRDFYFLQDAFGQSILAGAGQAPATPFLTSFGAVTVDGVTPNTVLDIPAGSAILPFSISVPNSYAAVPPSVSTVTVNLPIVWAATTVSAASLGCTGVATYKLYATYSETIQKTRQRAKKNATYGYEVLPTLTYGVTTGAIPATAILLATFTYNSGSSPISALASVQACLPVRHVATIAQLRALQTVQAGQFTVQPDGYYALGDGGGGPLRCYSSGFSPGHYTDNGGSIIVPTGGDGSAAWIFITNDRVSIKAFGAKGDGSTNDHTAIVNAIATGLKLYFPTGTYITGITITIAGGTIDWIGDGYDKTILQANVAVNGDEQIFFNNSINSRLQDICFSAGPSKASLHSPNAFGIYLQGVDGFIIDRCMFKNATTYGLAVTRDFAPHGAWIAAGDHNSQTSVNNLLALCSQRVVVRDCSFQDNGSNNFGAFGVNDLKLIGNHFDGTSANYDILTDDASQHTLLADYAVNDRVFIHNNNCQGSVSAGYTANNIVTDNIILGSFTYRSYDFDQQKYQDPVTLVYNIYPAIPFTWQNGFATRDILISGNIIGDGVIIRTGANKVRMVNNLIGKIGNGTTAIEVGNNGVLWPSGTSYYDNWDTSVQSALAVIDVSYNTIVANIYTGIVGLTYNAISPMLYLTAFGNRYVAYNGGTFANNVVVPGSSFWAYSFSNSATNDIVEFAGNYSRDSNYLSSVLKAGSANGFKVANSLTKMRVVNAAFGSDFFITANWEPTSDTTGAIDNASYNTIGIRFSPSTGRFEVWTIAAANTIPVSRFQFMTGAYRPTNDNADTLGDGTHRWSVVYAATGAINTSDKRDKQDISSLSDAEKRVALKLKASVKKFRFKDAVAEKGDDARIHVGVIAQEVVQIFASEGLDATRYALLCYDEWDDEWEPLLDEKGNIIEEHGKLVTKAGNRYGIRYDELMAFIIGSM